MYLLEEPMSGTKSPGRQEEDQDLMSASQPTRMKDCSSTWTTCSDLPKNCTLFSAMSITHYKIQSMRDTTTTPHVGLGLVPTLSIRAHLRTVR